MVLNIKDRIQQGTNTAGQGTITLHVSYSGSGFQDFSVLGNGTQTYYTITEAEKWEVGIGTYNTNTLSRDTILDSSAGGSKINLGGSGLAFVTYPAAKAVFADADNNASVTGLIVGQTGVKFNDGTIQTTAFTGIGGLASEAYVTGASGYLQTQITNNDSDISTVSGTASTNSSNISIVSGLTVDNSNNINTVSGLIGSEIPVATGQKIDQNTADISTVSGLIPGYSWNISDIASTSNISNTETVYVTGKGDIFVDLVGNTLIISGSGVDPDLSSYATQAYVTGASGSLQTQITSNSSNISTNTSNLVATGASIVVVSGTANTNASNISTNTTNLVATGAKIDTLSGTVVTNTANISKNSGDIVTVSGLIGAGIPAATGAKIDANSADILIVSGLIGGGVPAATGAKIDANTSNLVATGAQVVDLSGMVTTNTSNLVATGAQVVDLSGMVTTNTSNISSNTSNLVATGAKIDTLSGTVVTNTSNISANTANLVSTGAIIDAVSGNLIATGAKIDTVSGLLYNHWTITDGTNSENISGANQVKFTGGGATVVSYNTANNTVTVNTPSSEAGYEYWTATDGTRTSNVSNGNNIKFTGEGSISVTFTSGSPNILQVSGDASVPVATGEKIDSNTTNLIATGAQVVDLSGMVTTNTSNISSNTSNLVATGAIIDALSGNLIATGDIVDNLSGTVVTNTSNISTNTSNLIATGAQVVDLSGMVTTNTSNLVATGAQVVDLSGMVVPPQYLTLAADSNLTNERVFTTGAGVGRNDAGAGGAYTVSVNVDDSSVEVFDGTNALRVKAGGVTAAMLNTDVTLDEITDHGATTTNNITVGTTTTSGVLAPLVSGSGSSSVTFDLSTASTFTHSIDQTTTLALSNVTDGQKFMIRLKQNSAGSKSVNWFSTIYWAEGGTAPTLTTSAYHSDVFGFLCTTSGYYEGFVIGQNISGV